MANDKWNDIWKIMKSGRLEFVDTSINDILCIICNKVLINAYSGPCGCRYCLECITNYLNGEQKICPGNTHDCKDELININNNVSIDRPMNIKLSKIIVKCPEKNCDFQDEVRNIENHMRICDSQSVECPFVLMGCKECNLVDTDMKKHMLTEIVSHTKLMFEYIDNLKNEIKMLKEDKVKLEKNEKNIKKYMNDFQLKYENDYEEIKVKLKEIEKKYDDEQKSINDSKLKYENENRELKEKLKQIENKLTKEQKSIDDSKSKCENKKREIEKKIKEIENKCDERKRESATKIDKMNKIITDLKSNESDKSILNVMNEVRVLQKNQEQGNCGEFVWRIDKWREKMKKYFIDSESFYSHRNGYKMYLRVWPNGFGSGSKTHLSVSCRVMQGECDDILPWPFKHGVTFELINQHTTQIHTSSTVRYGDQYEDDRISNIEYNSSNQNPKKINNSDWICYDLKIVTLEELSNNRSLIDNDQIFIRCRVNIDNR